MPETKGARICGEGIGQSAKSGMIADKILRWAHAPRPGFPADDEPGEKRRKLFDVSGNAFGPFKNPIHQSCHVIALFVSSPLRPVRREEYRANRVNVIRRGFVRTMMLTCRDPIECNVFDVRQNKVDCGRGPPAIS